MALIFRKDENINTISAPQVKTAPSVRTLEAPTITDYFRSVQTIKVGADGSITPNNIDLGYQGDSNVTKIIFDVSDLQWHNSLPKNYVITLSFYNPLAEFHEDINPLIYEIDHDAFLIPEELTTFAQSYQVILSIKENVFDTAAGNLDNPAQNEIFISSVFTAHATSNPLSGFVNGFDQAELPYIENQNLIALVKNKIELRLENNQLALDSTNFGNKMDSNIKYINIKNLPWNTNLDDYWYILFNNETTHKLIKIKSLSDFIWIPAELTQRAGTINVTLIARNPQQEKYLWYNIVKGQVADNFLQSLSWLTPNRGDGNLISSDNYYFVSSDGLTITSAEG